MKHKILTFTALAILLCGCGDSSLDTTYNAQSEKIQKFVESQLESKKACRVAYSKGVARLVIKEGDGDELESGGTVSFRYAGYNFNNGSINSSSLFATNDEEIAKANKWNVADESLFGIAEIRLGKDDIVEGLKIGLSGVRAGEECYVLFNGKNGSGNKQSGTIPANAAIAYHLNILEVNNK